MEIAECEACHGNHEIVKPSKEMLGTSDEAVCMQCHDEGSTGYNTVAAMRAEIDTLDMQISQAQESLSKARNRRRIKHNSKGTKGQARVMIACHFIGAEFIHPAVHDRPGRSVFNCLVE